MYILEQHKSDLFRWPDNSSSISNRDTGNASENIIIRSFKSFPAMTRLMRKKIPHLLIPILWPPLDAEKSYIRKIVPKTDFTGIQIVWVELKSNKPVGLISSICWKCYSIHFRKFWPKIARQLCKLFGTNMYWLDCIKGTVIF